MRQVAFCFLLLITAASCKRGILSPAEDGYAHLLLGNPSQARTDVSLTSNYLLRKPQYALSFNDAKGGANWVSWHLQPSDLGTADRQNDFRPDEELPPGFYRVKPSDYTNSGFDRGHVCPSGDRTATETDNSATFVMSNMLPQAPALNRGLWSEFEQYCRDEVKQGNEVYIVAGGYGAGGIGSEGYGRTVGSDKVTVPSNCWKVVLILPLGERDLDRIKTTTRTIAVDVPNSEAVSGKSWQAYQTTVREVERRTGYDFFSSVPADVQNQIEVQ